MHCKHCACQDQEVTTTSMCRGYQKQKHLSHVSVLTAQLTTSASGFLLQNIPAGCRLWAYASERRKPVYMLAPRPQNFDNSVTDLLKYIMKTTRRRYRVHRQTVDNILFIPKLMSNKTIISNNGDVLSCYFGLKTPPMNLTVLRTCSSCIPTSQQYGTWWKYIAHHY